VDKCFLHSHKRLSQNNLLFIKKILPIGGIFFV
jgi:hypothetical protein